MFYTLQRSLFVGELFINSYSNILILKYLYLARLFIVMLMVCLNSGIPLCDFTVWSLQKHSESRFSVIRFVMFEQYR
jgi:hypothetical protein